jgi:hypothetical protein
VLARANFLSLRERNEVRGILLLATLMAQALIAT